MLMVRKILFVSILSMFLAPRPSRATIIVDPGTYTVQALVLTDGRKEPEAVFNLRTRSSLRIGLKGAKARALLKERTSVWNLTLQVHEKIQSSHAEAELLKFEAVDGNTVPILVGNQFKPTPTKGGY